MVKANKTKIIRKRNNHKIGYYGFGIVYLSTFLTNPLITCRHARVGLTANDFSVTIFIMEEDIIKTTIRIPKILVKQYKELAKKSSSSLNDSIRIAMECFLSKDPMKIESLIIKKKKSIHLPSKNLGKINSVNRKDIYECAF